MYAPDRASNLMWQKLIEPKKKWMNLHCHSWRFNTSSEEMDTANRQKITKDRVELNTPINQLGIDCFIK